MMTRYFGKICDKHPEINGERRLANRSCVSCSREKVHARAKTDEFKKKRQVYLQTDVVKKRRAAYRENNKKVISEKYKIWYAANKDKMFAHRKNWQKNNAGRVNAHTRGRDAAKLRATPSWANKSEILKFYNLARVMSEYTGERYEVDHIIPLKGRLASGFHVENNLQILTKSQNCSKRNNIAA